MCTRNRRTPLPPPPGSWQMTPAKTLWSFATSRALPRSRTKEGREVKDFEDFLEGRRGLGQTGPLVVVIRRVLLQDYFRTNILRLGASNLPVSSTDSFSAMKILRGTGFFMCSPREHGAPALQQGCPACCPSLMPPHIRRYMVYTITEVSPTRQHAGESGHRGRVVDRRPIRVHQRDHSA